MYVCSRGSGLGQPRMRAHQASGAPDSVLPSAPSVLADPAPTVAARPAQNAGPERTPLSSRPSAAAAEAATAAFCSRYMRVAAARRGWRSTQAPTAAPASTDTAPSSRPQTATSSSDDGCSSSMTRPTANSKPR